MIKALLCDIDGTLVDSNWLHAEAWQTALGAVGVHLDREELRRQIGKGGNELIPIYVPWWRRERVQDPLKAFRKFIFESEFRQRVKPIPGVRELFVRLKGAGISISLATSASSADIEIYQTMLNIADLTDKTTTAEDTSRAKPHPDIFARALELLGLKPQEAMALGDTPWDAEAAGKLGVGTIGVTTGGWTRQELLDAGCVEVYLDVLDLVRNFEESALVRPPLF